MSEGGNIIRIIGGQSTWTSKQNLDLIATDGDVSIGSPTKVNIEGIDGGQRFGAYEEIKDPFFGNAFIPIIFVDETVNNYYEIITQKDKWEVLDENLDAHYKQPKIKEIKFKSEEKKKVIIKFNVKKGNSKANDSDGGNIRVNLYDKEKKLMEKYEVPKNIKYGDSFEFDWDITKGINLIQFYADDNDRFFDGGVSNVRCGVFKIYEEEECECLKFKLIDGFVSNSKIEVLKKGTTPLLDENVKIIVLHRTHYNLKNDVKNLILNNKYPVHFWVNGDGKIYQQTSLNNMSYHIGVAQKSHTKSNKWGNNNSISIEVNGEYFDKNGKRANQEVEGGYWEDLTKEQAESVACLVSFLMKHYNLSIKMVQVHEDLCVKTKGEGKTVYDAMLPLLK